MKKKVLLSSLVILVIIIFASYNYINSDTESLKIGVISSMTGLTVGGDNLGEGFTNGVILAKEDHLKKDPSAKITIVVEDDGYDSKKGVSAYQKITSIDNVPAIINLSSATIDSVSEQVRESGIPFLQLGAESEIYEDNIFQIFPDQTSVGLIGKTADEDGTKTVFVAMHQIKAYEKFLSDFDDNFNGEIILERIAPSEKDLSSLALKIKDADPEGLLIFMGSVEASQLIKKLRDLNYKPNHMYFDLGLQFGEVDYVKTLGDLSFLEGAKSLYSVSETTQDFKDSYEERFGIPPGMLSGFGYDSYLVITETYNKNVDKWLDNIQNYKGVGVTGAISFDKSGLRPPQWEVAEVVDGKLIVKK